MRKILLSLVLGLVFSSVSAQTEAPKETVYQDWIILGESSNHVDISYRVVKCGSVAQVHLFVFNESGIDQQAKFTLHISSDDKKFSKDVTFDVKNAGMYQAECKEDAATKSLKIDLPEGYNPEKLAVKITFNF